MLMPATAQEVVDRDDQSAVADSAALNDVHQEGNGQDWVQTLRLNLDHLLASNMFKTSQVGLMVYDLTADSVLYAHNERQLMRPASTMKVITAITALDRLGGAHQFSTDLCYKGKIENQTLTGTIYCVGGFDPRFNSDDMRAFAESIHKMGVDTIRGKIVANTVGFIRKLPTDLVDSFKSTLDEVREADLLLHVVDISHPDFEEQINVVENTLKDLGCADKPSMIVFNKIDNYTWTEKEEDDLTPMTKDNITLDELKRTWMARLNENCLFISAKEKENIDEFRETIYNKVREMHVQKYPYNDFLYEVVDE